MNEEQILQNLLVFMSRVPINPDGKGNTVEEVGYYAACSNWLNEKLEAYAPSKDESEAKANGKAKKDKVVA